jgi:TetR/AcrR family transcriptional regulator, fatty acid biosynthesis regulator
MPTRSPAARTAPAERRRQRLAPEARAAQILDAAAQLLLNEGFTEVSMERLGREAGVSKALVYNYFPNRNELLRALLQREMGLLRESQSRQAKAAESFEDLVRRTTRLYIDNMKSRGPLLRKLWAEPAVARSLEEEHQRSRNETMLYLSRRVSREYGLPRHVALSAVDMGMALTEAAAQHLAQSNDDVEVTTEICVTLLLGGMAALAQRYAPAAVVPARKTARTVKPEPAPRRRR